MQKYVQNERQTPAAVGGMNHFNPSDEQKQFGNVTTKILKFLSFHCVRGASNAFCFVLDTVTPCTAVHCIPQPLYPSRNSCTPAFIPE